MVLRILRHISPFRLQDSHLLRSAFPHCSATALYFFRSPYPKCIATLGLASSDFARHYFRNLGWFLFLRVLRCFSSPGSLRKAMYLPYVPWFFTMGVSPFGNLRIKAHLRLPVAYRSLSRPSSAPDAKAFTLCSCSLELPSFGSRYLLNCLSFYKCSGYCAWKVFLYTTLNHFHHVGEIVLYPFLERPNCKIC